MRLPTTITSDGAPGLINAITACFPASLRIRCWFHRLTNIRTTLPDKTAGEVLAHVYAVRDATLEAVLREEPFAGLRKYARLLSLVTTSSTRWPATLTGPPGGSHAAVASHPTVGGSGDRAVVDTANAAAADVGDEGDVLAGLR